MNYILVYYIQISELQEALYYKKNLVTTSETMNFGVLIDKWNNRKSWIGDDYNVWNDINACRQTYYTSIILHNEDSRMDSIKLAQVNNLFLNY